MENMFKHEHDSIRAAAYAICECDKKRSLHVAICANTNQTVESLILRHRQGFPGKVVRKVSEAHEY